jgi:hypothetical protein
MKRHEIEILVDLGGFITGTVMGVKGMSCRAITEILSEIGRTDSTKPTSEYYQESIINHTITCREDRNFSQ